jgi:hypothetical protein
VKAKLGGMERVLSHGEKRQLDMERSLTPAAPAISIEEDGAKEAAR